MFFEADPVKLFQKALTGTDSVSQGHQKPGITYGGWTWPLPTLKDLGGIDFVANTLASIDRLKYDESVERKWKVASTFDSQPQETKEPLSVEDAKTAMEKCKELAALILEEKSSEKARARLNGARALVEISRKWETPYPSSKDLENVQTAIDVLKGPRGDPPMFVAEPSNELSAWRLRLHVVLNGLVRR